MDEVQSRSESPRRKRRPAITPEGRENQMIDLAVDLAERQLQEGTASAQVITHFLKLGTMRERLEREKLRSETELLLAKKESIQSAARIEDIYKDAMAAMRLYNGQDDSSYED